MKRAFDLIVDTTLAVSEGSVVFWARACGRHEADEFFDTLTELLEAAGLGNSAEWSVERSTDGRDTMVYIDHRGDDDGREDGLDKILAAVKPFDYIHVRETIH